MTATVYDNNNNLVPGVAVTFSTNLGSLGTTGSVSPNVNGQAADTITSTTAGTATVQAQVSGVPTVSSYVYFTPTITVTSLAPSSGPVAGGTLVTVEGTSLNTANSVYFGSVTGTVYGTPTSVSLSVYAPPGPSGDGSVYVVVYGNGGPSAETSAGLFTYYTPVPKPTITPDGAVYTGSVSVSISGIASGDNAYYNLSSAIPAKPATSTLYGGSFNVDNSTTVTAAVYDAVYGEWSPAATASFTILPVIPGNSGGGGSTAQPVNNTGSATLNPATGGTVWLGNDEVGVTIPDGALQGSSDVNVTIQNASSPPAAPSGFMLLGSVYQFTVGGADHYTFNSPVTLTFSFDPSQIPAGETPAVYYWDNATSQWVDIGGTVNWTNDTITVTVDHFTKYAVFATKTAQAAKPAAPVFSDVPSSYWAYDVITSLSSKGIVSGYPDGTFKPGASITRAEFATMLVKALGLNATGTTGQFKDVTISSWCYNSVNDVVYADLACGMGDHLFSPNALVTREQMAVMIAKALGSKAPAVNGTELDAFSDRSMVSSWAVTSMEEAAKAGIVSGMTPTTLAPLDNATRAEAAEMIYKLLNILGK